MKKCLITGVAGQLGYDLAKSLLQHGWSVVGTDLMEQYPGNLPITYVQLDITQKDGVEHTLSFVRPDIVFHCAAWTQVDLAELPENKEKVYQINAEATKNIAEACKKQNCTLLYLSTDYVFDGTGTTPWQEDGINFAPLNIYGDSKLQGEQAIRNTLSKYFIVRISWVFGTNGKNFINTMLQLAQKYDTLRVVNDQVGNPTYTKDLAPLLVQMAETDQYGTYHACNEGEAISWYDFACEIFAQSKYNVQVISVSTAEYGASTAKRPFNSRLSRNKLDQAGFKRLPHWKDALQRYLIERE
ncbi:MAG: dTDP-4-dehydrorhamnose reductase [Eubacteriales bacterium]|nr:dTDP-4-dehydrorhamnose reductase [Eubacteriales bacterium]